MGREEDYWLENAICKHATAKALLIEADELDEEVWVPLSQVSPESDVLDAGDSGTLIVTGWLAEQEGWK